MLRGGHVPSRRSFAWIFIVIGAALLAPIFAFFMLMVVPGTNLLVVAPSLVFAAGAATIAGIAAMTRGIILLRRA